MKSLVVVSSNPYVGVNEAAGYSILGLVSVSPIREQHMPFWRTCGGGLLMEG